MHGYPLWHPELAALILFILFFSISLSLISYPFSTRWPLTSDPPDGHDFFVYIVGMTGCLFLLFCYGSNHGCVFYLCFHFLNGENKEGNSPSGRKRRHHRKRTTDRKWELVLVFSPMTLPFLLEAFRKWMNCWRNGCGGFWEMFYTISQVGGAKGGGDPGWESPWVRGFCSHHQQLTSAWRIMHKKMFERS